MVLSTGVYVFNLMQMFSVEQHIKTYLNPRGVCAISSNNEKSVLATLGSEEGTFAVHNYYLKNVQVIKAFSTGIQHIAISLDVKEFNNSIGIACVRS